MNTNDDPKSPPSPVRVAPGASQNDDFLRAAAALPNAKTAMAPPPPSTFSVPAPVIAQPATKIAAAPNVVPSEFSSWVKTQFLRPVRDGGLRWFLTLWGAIAVLGAVAWIGFFVPFFLMMTMGTQIAAAYLVSAISIGYVSAGAASRDREDGRLEYNGWTATEWYPALTLLLLAMVCIAPYLAFGAIAKLGVPRVLVEILRLPLLIAPLCYLPMAIYTAIESQDMFAAWRFSEIREEIKAFGPRYWWVCGWTVGSLILGLFACVGLSYALAAFPALAPISVILFGAPFAYSVGTIGVGLSHLRRLD